MRLFFPGPPPACRDGRQARPCSKEHGRLEVRALVDTTDLTAWLAATGPGEVLCRQRTRQKRGQGRTPTPYGISRRMPRQADAARLLALGRAHGRLEDRLHWRWDVTLREDHCQVRTGAALLVRAALNNLLLAIFDLLGVQNVKEQMPRLDAQPQRVVRLLLGSLLTFTSPWGILPFLLTTSSPF